MEIAILNLQFSILDQGADLDAFLARRL